MNYEQTFPKILEKTYKNYKDISTDNLPLVKLKSFIFGEKNISLPFVDTVNLEKISKEDLKEKGNFEIKTSEANSNLSKFKSSLKKLGFKENIVKGHIVTKLKSEEAMWSSFHKHTRNDIRKGKKSNLKIRKINSEIELKKFYKLYLKEMRNFGTPQQSHKFFKNCLEILKDDFMALNCYKEKKLVGSIILFLNEDFAYVSFNVSNPKYRNLRPNDFLYWEAIKWSIKNKKKYFDIGQVDLDPKKGSREENLLKFKQKWLGEVYKKIYFTKGFKYSQEKKDNLKKFRSLWKFIPLPIVRFIGPRICSQLG